MLAIKFHRSYSVYFGSWGSIPYIIDDYGNASILDHNNMSQCIYHYTEV